MNRALAALFGALVLAASALSWDQARRNGEAMKDLMEEAYMQGTQSIKHTVQTASGPADVTTTRGYSETVSDWLDRHAAALSAATGG